MLLVYVSFLLQASETGLMILCYLEIFTENWRCANGPSYVPSTICNDLLSLLTETRQGGMTNCVQIATKMKSTFLFALAEILWLESQVQHRLFWSRHGGKRLVDHCKVSKMTNGSLLLSNVHRIVRMLFVLLYLLSSLQDRVGRSKD